jgi:hypothetical protein
MGKQHRNSFKNENKPIRRSERSRKAILSEGFGRSTQEWKRLRARTPASCLIILKWLINKMRKE